MRPLLFILFVKVEQACQGCGCYVPFIFSVILIYSLKMFYIHAMYFDVIHLPLPPSNSPWYPCLLSLIASHFPSFGYFYTLTNQGSLPLCGQQTCSIPRGEKPPLNHQQLPIAHPLSVGLCLVQLHPYWNHDWSDLLDDFSGDYSW